MDGFDDFPQSRYQHTASHAQCVAPHFPQHISLHQQVTHLSCTVQLGCLRAVFNKPHFCSVNTLLTANTLVRFPTHCHKRKKSKIADIQTIDFCPIFSSLCLVLLRKYQRWEHAGNNITSGNLRNISVSNHLQDHGCLSSSNPATSSSLTCTISFTILNFAKSLALFVTLVNLADKLKGRKTICH